MKTKNKFTSILIVLLSMYTILSCRPEDGIDGEQGPQGEVGQQGNANIKQYNFGTFVHSGSQIINEIPLTSTESETSMIYVFVGTIGFWYPLSGSVTKNYSYRIFFRNNSNITECLWTG